MGMQIIKMTGDLQDEDGELLTEENSCGSADPVTAFGAHWELPSDCLAYDCSSMRR